MEYLKVMFAGNDAGVIWNVVTENETASDHRIAIRLNEEIDLMMWKDNYKRLYTKWLHDNDKSIYDINHPVNREMIDALARLNEKSKDYCVLYWFDVDRDKYFDYVWEICPLSNVPLKLMTDFHKSNGKISPNYPLTFPYG